LSPRRGIRRKFDGIRGRLADKAKTSGTGESKLQENIKYLVSKSKINLHNIKRFKNKIDDPDIKNDIDGIIKSIEAVFDFLKENPDKSIQAGTFLENYLPDITKILNDYVSISSLKLDSEEASGFKTKSKDFLRDAASASNKFLNELYSDKIVNSSVNIDALKSSFISNGFLEK
jgi:5-bromo-4-chloroindolyl phosphate hydrolysis protein